MSIKLIKKKKKYLRLLIVILIVLIFTLGSLLITTRQKDVSGSNSELSNYAQRIIEKCANQPLHQPCYDDEIPKLLDFISMEETFEVTKLVQEEDKAYYWCHVLSHKIGDREYSKDPSKWEDVAMRCPNDICSNGCLHGVVQARFRNAENFNTKQMEEITTLLNNLCEARSDWSPTDNQQSSCYHGLGHISMYVTNGDIKKSIDLCGQVALKNDGRSFTRTCYEGIFMQLYQPREPEDFALVKGLEPKKENVVYFCNQFQGHENIGGESCILEAWVLYDPEIRSEEGIEKFCSYTSDHEAKRRCYNKLFYANFTFINFDYETMKKFCEKFKQDIASYCFNDTIGRMMSTDSTLLDESINVCSYAQKVVGNDSCFNALASNIHFVFSNNSPEFINACNLLPSIWRERCLNGEIRGNF